MRIDRAATRTNNAAEPAEKPGDVTAHVRTKRILFFGTYNDAAHPRIRVLREGFCESGDEVAVCNEPLAVDTAARVAILRSPWRAITFAWAVLRAWVKLIRRARAVGRVDAVVVGYLGHLDVHLARRLWRGVPIILDHLISLHDTAVDRRSRRGQLHRLLRAIDVGATRASDVIVVDTDEHRELLPGGVRDRSVVVTVGAAREWFRASLPPTPASDPLDVIFFGLYTPLHGTSVIGEAISMLSNHRITFTMVGTGQDLDATRQATKGSPAVRWIPWVEPTGLPDLVARHDVCLGIFGTTPKAMRVVPNKVFQGAAAGCAIVTSDTPPQRRALADAAVYVPAGNSQALAGALMELSQNPDHLLAMKRAAAEHAEVAFAPDVVVKDLREALR